jgi:hypothetical protein
MKYMIKDVWTPRFCALFGPGHPTHAVPDAPPEGVLLTCRDDQGATLFASRAAAVAAIARSVTWGQAHGFASFVEDSYKIMSEQEVALAVRPKRNGRKS